MTGPAEFFFDLGSPYAWLAAERIDVVFEQVGRGLPVWRPVLLGGLFQRFGRGSWANTDLREGGISEIERRAREYGLPEPVWPDPWPGSYLFAMRVATWAEREGRLREFALTSFRNAFTRGIDQADPGHVLDAAVEAGLDRAATEAGAADPEIKDALKVATGRAGDLGVTGVPSFLVDGNVYWGDDQLELAVRG
ncbi:MAG: DsbA family protein [Solirubrobacterales bacterium]|nr:DsbA family protein [Solirubrobacterales bacterium]MCB8915802.1 DsbA family protein [Thermoleophilales bacterium]